MTIFYARAYVDYDGQFEIDNILFIRDIFGEDVIEFPKLEHSSPEKYGIGLYLKEKKNFFPLIDKCGLFIMTGVNSSINKDGSKRSDKGKLSGGVRIEALYALAAGKKVYQLIEDSGGKKFIEINDISDSEELILSAYILNKIIKDNIVKEGEWSTLDNSIDFHKLFLAEKRLPQNIHPKICGLYERNSDVLELMNGLLSSGRTDIECIRPIAIQVRYPKVDAPIRYLPYGTRRHYTLEDLDIGDLKRYKGEMHIYKTFLDNKVLDIDLIEREVLRETEKLIAVGRKAEDFKPWMVFNKYVLGFGLVFDIDAPKALESIVGKVNMFDETWYNEFMIVKKETESFIERVLKLKYICATTGNGFNIFCEPYFFDERDDTLYNFIDTIDDIVGDININVERAGVKGVRVDEKAMDWSMYKKMIFTYHAKWNRITLPVRKGDVDRNWLMGVSDMDNFLKSERENLKEVIPESNLLEDAWW